MTAVATVTATSAPLRLYEIGEQLEIARAWLLEPEHQEQLIAAGGDLDALPELRDLLEGAEIDFSVKAERVAIMAREFGLSADAAKTEAERLTRIRKAYEYSETGLKAYLRIWLLKLNIKKVDGPRAKPRVQANPASVKSTLTPDELSQLSALESPFVRVERPAPVYSLDTDAVLAAWKHAEGVVGKCPEVGTPNYPALREEWDAAMDHALREAGVPAGVTVERGFHVRIG
jgi:hypothetical protein